MIDHAQPVLPASRLGSLTTNGYSLTPARKVVVW